MIKRHITGALHIGVTEEEISEIIAQMVFYGGMPAAVNAFRIAKETFDEQAERQGANRPRTERAPRDTPSGYAPAYRRESVGNYGPQDLEEGETPRVRPAAGDGQDAEVRPGPPRGDFNSEQRQPPRAQQGQPPRAQQGQPPRAQQGQPPRPQQGQPPRDRREQDETRVHRNRQYGQSDGRQSDQGRPPANRSRPASRGRNQPSGDGRRVGGQSQGGRPGQRRGPNQPPRSQGRRGGSPGRGRNTGGRR
ncbi:hypothetical protein GBAR_LOCUS28010 [Geodia barretti]|uniref:Carboxymuconolactone decarboxylase-like domain-containing protein n=1 Tax=Geodia barretti TaxID=519541 RepID=A0AA35TQ72_GEOBA|nr:hypothetical protein GBAR_LOCUS28010 [Geodia barretti]